MASREPCPPVQEESPHDGTKKQGSQTVDGRTPGGTSNARFTEGEMAERMDGSFARGEAVILVEDCSYIML